MTDNDIIDHNDLKLTVERFQAYLHDARAQLSGTTPEFSRMKEGRKMLRPLVLTGAPGPTRTGGLRIRRASGENL